MSVSGNEPVVPTKIGETDNMDRKPGMTCPHDARLIYIRDRHLTSGHEQLATR